VVHIAALVATLVPLPEVVIEQPVPQISAAVVFVADVTPLKATVLADPGPILNHTPTRQS
jgi:hypothetical protein